jgi:hypothetical protein
MIKAVGLTAGALVVAQLARVRKIEIISQQLVLIRTLRITWKRCSRTGSENQK